MTRAAVIETDEAAVVQPPPAEETKQEPDRIKERKLKKRLATVLTDESPAEQLEEQTDTALERVMCTACAGNGGMFEGEGVVGTVCPHCQGSGIEPGTLTDEQQQAILDAIAPPAGEE